MKTNDAGIALVKQFEGCRLDAYKDSVGVWTIGYGHTTAAGAPEVHPGLWITKERASEILVGDLAKFEAAVTQSLTRAAHSNQFAAMVSLAFNIGGGAFAKSSVARYFNEGQLLKAADAFLLWNKAGGRVLPGLTRRREAERALFLRT